MEQVLVINKSSALSGSVQSHGAKNAVLPILASLILTHGKSVLTNVPFSSDTMCMINLLRLLGAQIKIVRDEHILFVDTTLLDGSRVPLEIMQQMRASILVLGPLLYRCGKAHVALPGGCVIGKRSINFHLSGLSTLGACVDQKDDGIHVRVERLIGDAIVFDYPSVGATENLLMAAVGAQGTTKIVNASLEPEVMDLIVVLRKMGANITITPPATIVVHGVATLKPIEHSIIPDRLEVGTLLCAVAATKGDVLVSGVRADTMTMFLHKLRQMGHDVLVGDNDSVIELRSTNNPQSVSFKTGPYPAFPTDLQAPMMALQTIAHGTSYIQETVFENRLVHVRELQKMGAQINVTGNCATVIGVDQLYGANVIASDIRASASLAIAGFVAHGQTQVTGIQHWRRGYESLENMLLQLGARIRVDQQMMSYASHDENKRKQDARYK